MNDLQTEEMPKKKNWKLIGAFLAIVVLAIWAAIGWIEIEYYKTLQNSGVFGDRFGSMDALFSALAFAALVITLLMQQEDLNFQRLDLKNTQDQLKGQRVALEGQQETFNIQRFENTFFNLIDSHHGIITNMIYTQKRPGVKDEIFEGMKAIENFQLNLRKRLDHQASLKNAGVALTNNAETVQAVYDEWFKNNHGELGHYFRNLYHIIKFVHKSEIEDKQFYSDLIRAQVSSHEHLLLFYNGLGKYGKGQMKYLLTEYAFFDNMALDLVPHKRHLMMYGSKAYGDTDMIEYLYEQKIPKKEVEDWNKEA
jgi:hypothetical protein